MKDIIKTLILVGTLGYGLYSIAVWAGLQTGTVNIPLLIIGVGASSIIGKP